MKLTRSLFTALAVAMIAAPVSAQFNPSVTTSSELTKVTGGPTAPVGLYNLQLLQTPGQPIIDALCVDFVNGFPNNPGTMNFTRFDAGAATLDARTRFGSGALTQYMQAAWLMQFFPLVTDVNVLTDLHQAVWHLFTPGAPSTTRPGEAFWVGLLGSNQWQTINPQYWFIVSAPNMTPGRTGFPQLGGNQELLINVVPEPSTYALLATGLVGLVGVSLRRRNRK